ncbi:MAG: ATP phosphoribosyltransferase regulatory subunit [Lachnospiraceae bacterium]|nr:ATP phosphoribosyltransferase regulatory subunit [Lachnospiraceae bacterium]
MTKEQRENKETFSLSALRGLFRSYGYAEYRVNRFEDYELYARNRNFLRSDRILTFTDVDGSLKAMRPDVTLSIVRNYTGIPLWKVSYTENIYRPDENGFRQIPQTGLECLGDVDDVMQSEVLMLACRSLAMISDGYLMDLSHLGFVPALAAEAAKGEQGKLLLEAVRQKNTSLIRSICQENGAPEKLQQDLLWTAQAYGGPRPMLERMRQMVRNREMEEACADLERIVKGTVCFLPEAALRIDLSIMDDLHYYNGLIFRGMIQGLPAPILYGGRYDNLLTAMGKEGKAIGFAVYLDLLNEYRREQDKYDADVLLQYGDGDSPEAVIRAIEALRGQGFSVRAQKDGEGLRFRKKVLLGEEVQKDE